MSEDRYNIVFSGELTGVIDAAAVRAKLGATFRLDAARLDGLFSGQPVVVKRDVDLDTATRFQQVFLAAGARAAIELVAAPTPPAAAAPPADTPTATQAQSAEALALAPAGAPLEEIDDRGPPRNPDTSALSLVNSASWDLSDCEPPPTPTPQLDLESLKLEPLDARPPKDGQ